MLISVPVLQGRGSTAKPPAAEGPLPAVVGCRLRLCSSACLPGYLPKASEDQGSVRRQVGLPVRLCPGQVEPTLRSALRKRLYPMPVLPARPGSQLLFVRFLGEGILYLCVICHNVQGRV